MRRWILILFISIISIITVACGKQEPPQPDYEATKKMTLDILQTTEAKESLKGILSQPEMKHLLVIDSLELKHIIGQSLVDEKTQEAWKKIFNDPAVSENILKVTEENKSSCLKP